MTLLPLLLLLAACDRGERGLSGSIMFGDRPLAGAQVEIYLRGEKDRSTLPFAVTNSDDRGGYRISLPPGRYYVIGKKREELPGGQVRMLMAECPANPLEVAAGLTSVPPFSLREMGRDGGLAPDADTYLQGRIINEGAPVAEAFVYVYSADATGLMGPSYGEAVQSDAEGNFRINLPAGQWYLAARKRADGARMGEPAPGDLNGSFPGNPVTLAKGKTLDLGDFPLTVVDAKLQAKRQAEGKFLRTDTALRGRVTDQDGQPQARVYVFAYADSRMVGKPAFISDPTDAEGRYTLYLGQSGTYYIGARSTFGGPLEPGEWVGTFDGRADHGANAPQGKITDLADIIVREVW